MTSVAEIMDWTPLMESYAASEAIPMPPSIGGDPAELEEYYRQYDAFAAARVGNDYDYIHAVRFRTTAAFFGRYLKEARRVLELGGDSRIGVFAEATFGVHYEAYGRELRDRFEIPSRSFDCVLCLEVIEHLKDTLASETSVIRIASFNYSGVMNVLTEAYRVLEPGGVLLMTTPNASSVDVMVRVMRGDHPHLFDPHVREFAPKQLKAFAERVGFEFEAFGTFFAWGTADDATRARVLQFIAEMGFDPSNRGDDAVFVFRKPGTPMGSARESAAYWRAKHQAGLVPDYEEFLRESFERFLKPGDIVIDVGVNHGRHFRRFLELTGESGRTIGFEPVPAFVEHSLAVCGSASEIRQKALSDQPGSGEFLFMTNAVGESGFKERTSAGNRGAVPIQVEISTLDDELRDLPHLRYIKIDTEGHELSVLGGGTEIIDRFRPIISVEWGAPTYSLYGHSLIDLYAWAVAHNYRVSDLFGNVVVSEDEWRLVSDQSYWDFFLVPAEEIESWRAYFA